MRRPVNGLATLAVLMLLVLITGCSRDTEQGNLVVLLTDHEEAIDRFARLEATIVGVAIHEQGADRTQGWRELALPAPVAADLTALTEGRTTILAEMDLDPGIFDAARIAVGGARGSLLGSLTGSTDEIELAGLEETAALNFAVRPGRTTELTFDLTVIDVSDHQGGTFELILADVRRLQR